MLIVRDVPLHCPDPGAVDVEVDDAYNDHSAAEAAGYYAQRGVVTAKCHSNPGTLLWVLFTMSSVRTNTRQ